MSGATSGTSAAALSKMAEVCDRVERKNILLGEFLRHSILR